MATSSASASRASGAATSSAASSATTASPPPGHRVELGTRTPVASVLWFELGEPQVHLEHLRVRAVQVARRVGDAVTAASTACSERLGRARHRRRSWVEVAAAGPATTSTAAAAIAAELVEVAAAGPSGAVRAPRPRAPSPASPRSATSALGVEVAAATLGE